MKGTNRYGLERDIPESVKLAVRQNSGFGCVICGMGIYDYEHVEPEFKDAQDHVAASITLLCPNHHAMKTRGTLPKTEVKKHMKSPAAFKSGFTFGPLFYEGGPIKVKIGDSVFSDTPYPITVGGIPMLSVRHPIDEGGPVNISAIMADYSGQPMMGINNNEWRASNERWDVKSEGSRITIRNGPKNIGLRFKNDPSDGIVFESARIAFAGLRIIVSPNGALECTLNGQVIATFAGVTTEGCRVGIGFSLPPELIAAAKAWMRVQGAAFDMIPQLEI